MDETEPTLEEILEGFKPRLEALYGTTNIDLTLPDVTVSGYVVTPGPIEVETQTFKVE